MCDTLTVMKGLQSWTTLPVLAAGLALAVPAGATPDTGTTVETLSKNTVDGIEYTVARITVDPGGGTGWHYHPGEVFGVIRQGTMTHYDGGCVVDEVYNTGSAVAEGVGSAAVHDGRNDASIPLVMDVTYINPVGTPLSVDVPAPSGCPIP